MLSLCFFGTKKNYESNLLSMFSLFLRTETILKNYMETCLKIVFYGTICLLFSILKNKENKKNKEKMFDFQFGFFPQKP